MTFIEELFNSAGDCLEGDFIKKIIDSVAPSRKEAKDASVKKDDRAKKDDPKKKTDQKKESDAGLKKDHFKPFIEALEKENYPVATIELLELGAKTSQLNTNDNYHALLTFCFVALKKYHLADFADKLARKHNSEWENVFDGLTDDVYDSGLRFAADSLNKDVRTLNLEAKLDELDWEQEDVQFLIDDLSKILKLENEKLAKTIGDEKFTPPIDAKSTLDDVVISLCDELILPFYARLELQKVVKKFKD